MTNKMTKNSFVLRSSYADIFADMSDKQAGALIKVIFNYVTAKDVTEGLQDVEVKMAWKFIKQDIDYDTSKYNSLCEQRAEYGKKGGRPKEQALDENQKKHKVFEKAQALDENQKKHKVFEKAQGFLEKHIDSDSDVVSVVDSDSDINKQLTAPKVAESVQPKPKQLNDLQKFASEVAKRFEDPLDRVQLGIWFKRNCRCLTDILNFCGKDIPLALETIGVCVERLEKAGLSGGYEAVLRNIPDYYTQAKKRLESGGKAEGILKQVQDDLILRPFGDDENRGKP